MIKHNYSLDYLKAISIIFVVGWHLKIFNIFPTIIAVPIYFYILLIAVPIFFTISLFLFFKKINNYFYFKKRITHLIQIYLSWLLFGVLFTITIRQKLPSLLDIPFIIITGGYIYYFFFSLIVLTTISYFFWKYIRIRNQNLLLFYSIASAILLTVLPIIEHQYFKNSFLSQTYNALNYIPYIFIALLVTKKKFHPIMPILGIIFVLFESFYYQPWKDVVFPLYARGSLVFITYVTIKIVLSLSLKKNKLISALSQNTLGIYAVHIPFLDFYNGTIGFPNSSLQLAARMIFVILSTSITIIVYNCLASRILLLLNSIKKQNFKDQSSNQE